MKYDVLLVLGTGIRADGTLPESAESLARKAVELIKQGAAKKVIFSGRWSYRLKYEPPTTEAKAMADYATTLGLHQDTILIENESVTTVSNLCLLKEQYLEPNNFTNVLLISIKPLDKRALFNASMVLGPNYTIDVIYTDFSYPAEKALELEAFEHDRLMEAQRFHSQHTPGDHKTILELATKDLEENYLGKD